MEDDQQFCLRWNNHQATLIAVFDKLLENETLVDCTLAAEGKYLNAHKVVLSACSPYFESLLSQNYDKHPIFILKDVKYLELKAMMDYMYRGEVNISQDSLSGLLRAAESLQIKGLSDNRSSSSSRSATDEGPSQAKRQAQQQPQQGTKLPNKGQGLTITEQRGAAGNRVSKGSVEPPPSMQDDREGSTSPGPSRRRKRARRKSTDTEDNLNHHDGASNSSESHQSGNLMTTSATTTTTNIKGTRNEEVPAPLIETKADLQHAIQQQKTNEQPAFSSCNSNQTATSSNTNTQLLSSKQEPSTSSSQSAAGNISQAEVMLEPKSEYIDDMNEDSIEDLTLDDDDLSNMEDGAGPSGQGGGESNQGFGWHMNPGQDEVFMAAQEAVGAHRDSQEYLELDQILAPADEHETLRSILRLPITTLTDDSPPQSRHYNHHRNIINKSSSVNSMRKFLMFNNNNNNNNTSPTSGIGNPGYSSESQFACRHCGKRYRWKSTMRRHEQVECGGKEPSFQCSFCPYRAKQKGNLGVHVRKHHSALLGALGADVSLKEERAAVKGD